MFCPGSMLSTFRYPYKTISENCFYFQFSFGDVLYKVALIADKGHLQKSTIWGCDRFKALLTPYNRITLLKFVKRAACLDEVAFVLMKFIHAYAPIQSPIALILEELKAYGFARVSDISEDFSGFTLNESNVTVQCVDGEAFCGTFKVPLRRGFLAQIVKTVESQQAKRHQTEAIFAKIDESFATLAPERNSSALKRVIFVGRSQEPVKICFNDSGFLVNGDSIPAEGILTHLQSLIPTPLANSSDFDCGICYSDYLGGQLTDFHCNNHVCKHAYHQSCLLAWFKANPACQCNFSYYTGPCLFCEQVKKKYFKYIALSFA